jgi:hypothetical protein
VIWGVDKAFRFSQFVEVAAARRSAAIMMVLRERVPRVPEVPRVPGVLKF